MDQPWLPIGIGTLFTALAGLLAFLAIDTDTSDLMLVAWGLGALGSLALLVGFTALAVEIGIRAARR